MGSQDLLECVKKAGVLTEALPYIKAFHQKTIVIKYGGNAMTDEELKKAVVTDIVLMKYVGMNPVLVHGGGPEITAFMEKVGKKCQFVDGLRVSDGETVELAEMVLAGKLNKEIVALINRSGGNAVGVCGKDGGLIIAKKKLHKCETLNGTTVRDLGFVGEIERINTGIVETLIGGDYIPVVAPTGVGETGESYNINADTAAGELACALKADKLVILTDVEGIFKDPDTKTDLISTLKVSEVRSMIRDGRIEGGMIPKVQACIRALEGNVTKAHIIDGRIPHSLLLEIFTDQGIGTEVVMAQ
jgi:acetylglutamate kinase